MKTKIVYGMIALLSVSLFFFGCDTGTGSDSSSRPDPNWPPTPGTPSAPSDPQAAQVLASTLNEKIGSTAIYANGNEVFIPEGTVVEVGGADIDKLEIPYGVKLTVRTGGSLVIDDSLDYGPADSNQDAKLLTIEGTLEVFGTLKIGDSTGGHIANTAPLVVPSRGTLILRSAINPTETSIINNGTLTMAVNSGLTYAAGTIENNGTLNVSSTGTGGSAVLTIPADKFTNTSANSVINVTNGGGLTITTAVYPNTKPITVEEGGSLTFAAGLTNSGTGAVITLAGGDTPGALTVSGAGVLTNAGTITGAGSVTLGTGGLENTNTFTVGSLVATGATITNTKTFTVGTLTEGTIGNTAGTTGEITIGTGTSIVFSANPAGTKITVTGTVAATSVGANAGTITVGTAGALTVGAAFTNTGTLKVNGGNFTVSTGGITNNNTTGGGIEVNGGTVKATGATITNTAGNITVENGGAVITNAAITFTAGKATVKGDTSRVAYDDTGTTNYVGPATGTFRLAAGAQFSYDADSYDVEAGIVTLAIATGVSPLGTAKPLKVTGGGTPATLVIGTGVTLSLTNDDALVGTAAGAKIDNTDVGASITGAGATKFFPAGSATETPGHYVYTWTANAGNTSAFGWERP
jgi:hypothetical protein